MYRKSIYLVSCLLAVGFVHAALAVVPGNDNCQNAKTVGNVTDLSFNTSSATFDGPGHFIFGGPNIWYCYTATCNGCATVSLLGSSFDTKVAVYDGCECDPLPSRLIRTNDDFEGKQSQVTFPVRAGYQYLIEVGGFADATGPGVMTITCGAGSGGPSNDDCSYAEDVSEVANLEFSTVCATFDGPGHCLESPNLWYRYTASSTREITVSLFAHDMDFDTKLAVYKWDDCYPGMDALIECNDDFGNNTDSQITFQATRGQEYLIEVGGLHSDIVGRGSLSILGDVPPVMSNDKCENAWPIGDVENLPFDTGSATFDGPGHCMNSANRWYCYTAPCTGQATISLCGSSFDTMLAVYSGCGCYPDYDDMIACNDDSCDTQSEVTIDVIAGKRYLIEVGGYGSETGQGLLTVSTSCEGDVVPDLGDAPDSRNNFDVTMTAYPGTSIQAHYPTVFDDGKQTFAPVPFGPAHLNLPMAAYLGKKITSEAEADSGPDEDGENNIQPSKDLSNKDRGDDGVAVPLNLPSCQWVTFDYEVTVVDPQTDLWVNVWLDWNRDGDWDDAPTCDAGVASEWAVQNQLLFDLPVGLNQVTTPAFLPWHPKSGPEKIWMRITLSERPWKGGSNPGETGNGGSGPATRYLTGETEDYLFTPEKIGVGDCPLCQDVNGDGVIDMIDLTDLTALWLGQCL